MQLLRSTIAAGQNKNHKHAPPLSLKLLVAGALALACTPAFARGFDYGAPQRTINAGVIADYGDATTSGFWPSVFYQLSATGEAKPVGWTITNPIAPHETTQDIVDLWGGFAGALDSPISEASGPYWQVLLKTVSQTQLAKFQVLLLPLGNSDPMIAPADMEKLRQYVDGGGILWIDLSTTVNLSGSGSTGSSFDGWFHFDGVSGSYPRGTGLIGAGPLSSPGIPAISSPYDLTLGRAFDYMASGYPYEVDASLATDPSGFLGEYEADSGSGPANAYVAEGHLGAGAVVVSAIGASATIDQAPLLTDATTQTLTPLPSTYIPVLQFVSDIISQSSNSLTAQRMRQPASASGDAFGTSVTPTWRYLPAKASSSTTQFPQASLYGRFAYVPSPADALLHWLVVTPGTTQTTNEALTSDYKPQAIGSATALSSATVWPGYVNLGNASADNGGYDGFTYAFVEDNGGNVDWVDMNGGATGTLPVGYNGKTGSAGLGAMPTFIGKVPPAPFVYDHSVYAVEPDGQLYVYDLLNQGFESGTTTQAVQGVTYNAAPNPAGSNLTQYATGSPVAGIVHDDCNNVVVAFPTTAGLYTVLAGAHGERLSDAGFDPSGNRLYVPKLSGSTPMNPNNPTAKINNISGQFDLYQYTSAGRSNLNTARVDGTGQHFSLGTTGPNTGASEVFADYVVDWYDSQLGTPTNGALDRLFVPYAKDAAFDPSGKSSVVSTPVMDQRGYIYYIDNFTSTVTGFVNSSLICVRDGYPFSNARMIFRYRLPMSGETTQDGFGNSYSWLAGYEFVGAPVLDARGNVYAAASNGTNVAILSFNPDQPITVNLHTGSVGINPSVEITQPSNGPSTDEWNTQGGTIIPATCYGADTSGLIRFTNFGTISTMNQPNGGAYGLPGSTAPTLQPLFNESFPVTVQYTLANGQGVGIPPTAYINTNVNWSADLSNNANSGTSLPSGITAITTGIGGLVCVGDYLYFTSAGANPHLYRMWTRGQPTIQGGVLNLSGQNSDNKEKIEDLGPVGVGNVDNMFSGTSNAPAPPTNGDLTATDGYVLVSGYQGVAAFQSQLTIVTDQNRIIGLDSDGDAVFTIASTDEPQNYNQTSPPATIVTTHVPFNRPTSVSQLGTDRFLVADSGNNRCVEVDRQGNILWELSSFQDPNNLLSPDAPVTLDDPTSVEVRRDNQGNVHYLIADSGNYRILDVVDTYANGVVSPTHQLAWVSQTPGRKYRFEDAFYYNDPGLTASAGDTNKIWIAALVTNKRIAPASGTGLSPAGTDSPGASIVLLDGGYTTAVYGQTLPDPFSGSLLYALDDVETAVGSGKFTSLKNPSFLGSYTPDANAATQLSVPYDGRDELLYGDANGAFDLDPIWAPTSGTAYAKTNWVLTPSAYQSINTPIDVSGTTVSRSNFPFVPTSIERIGTDLQSSTYYGRYLIANAYSQGSVPETVGSGTVPAGFGGEVFIYSALSNQVVTPRTCSRPANTSPLSRPTCAVLAK